MRILILIFAFLIQGALCSQADFPADYLGKWSGELSIYSAEGLRQKVPMQLHILPVNDSTYTYTIIYGEDLEAGKRNYLLRPGNTGEHHWIVDEQDGILLDNFYLGGVLHGPFSVMGTLLNASLEKRGDQLYYTISSGPEEAFSTSGTKDEKGEEIKVNSFGVRSFQVAWLSKL